MDVSAIDWRSTKDLLRQAARTTVRTMPGGMATIERARGAFQHKVSYSQFGEDLHLRSFYDRLLHERGVVVHDACVVDIGAYRPIVDSNSYLFYRLGWRGINIDPTPGLKRRFDPVRPRDTNLEIGIAPEAGTATFFLFGEPSVFNTLSPEAAAHVTAVTGQQPREVAVTLARLDSVLDAQLGDSAFEMLLIDAEGYDIEILRSADFTRHRPRVILIEVMGLSTDTLATSPVVRHLRDHGYAVHSWINPNLMLVREDSMLAA